MSVVVLDTDVASVLLRRRTPDSLARQLVGHIPAISFVTIGELTNWTLVGRWGPRSLAAMQNFLAGLVVLPYDHGVAVRWGELQAYAQRRGPTAPSQRQLDRGLLPGPRPAARHVQHQGLCGLCRARRASADPRVTA